MLKFPCLVLDHDDTVVQSEYMVNYPCFCQTLEEIRPGTTLSFREYVDGCCQLGFLEMCRQWYHFTEQELDDEYQEWLRYVRSHCAPPYPGIDRVIQRQKAEGGLICVVSHSSEEIIRRDYANYFSMQPDAVFGWELPENQRKPMPYPLQAIMEQFHLAPQQLLVVDDLSPGYEMASSVGVPAAFAGWGRLDFPEITSAMTRLCPYSFQSIADLEKFLFED